MSFGDSEVSEWWQAALTERKRLAELITWQSGSPTKPGLYLVRAMFGGKVITSHDLVDGNYQMKL